MSKNGKRNYANSSINMNDFVNSELTADDLALIGSGLALLGDLFEFLSLLKLQQEAKEADKGLRNR